MKYKMFTVITQRMNIRHIPIKIGTFDSYRQAWQKCIDLITIGKIYYRNGQMIDPPNPVELHNDEIFIENVISEHYPEPWGNGDLDCGVDEREFWIYEKDKLIDKISYPIAGMETCHSDANCFFPDSDFSLQYYSGDSTMMTDQEKLKSILPTHLVDKYFSKMHHF